MPRSLETLRIWDGTDTYKIWVEGGESGIDEVSFTDDSIFIAGGGQGRFGDGAPLFANNEQRTWEGGRGLEFFSDDQTRYNDSQNAWSLTPGKLAPSPQWFFGTNYRDTDLDLPGDVDWRHLYSDSRYISRSFSASASYSADKLYLWVRRIGTPGTLTVELCADNSGDPGTVNQTVTKTVSDITDYITILEAFDWSGTESLTSGTTYHIKAYGASTDTLEDHWDVGVGVTTSNSKYSSDDATYTTASYSMYFRVVAADESKKAHFFMMDHALYNVWEYLDQSTASTLWINGDRGLATAGTSTTLTDSNAAFGTSSEFDGALVKIIRGTGANSAPRTISSHTATVLTVSEAFEVTPDSTSVYVIYATPRWKELTTTGLSVVKDVAVYDNVAHFAQGEGTNIRKCQWDSATPGHVYRDDGTNKASVLEVGYVAGTGNVLWRANNDTTVAGANTVSRATEVAYGANHTFGTAIVAGNGNYQITNLVHHTDQVNSASRVYVMKTGELGYIDNDKWYKMKVDIGSFPENTNGVAALAHGLYLWFGWSWSLERLYGTAIDDIDPNREAGLPTGRQGYVSHLLSHPVGPVVSIDAGSGTSSMLMYDGINYHEIFRAFEAGKSITDAIWQANEGTKKYLWVGVGDDMVYMEFPEHHRNPLKDTTQKYMHEMVLTTAIYDMSNSTIYKVWHKVEAITQNLQSGIFGELDYRVGDDLDTTTWTVIKAGTMNTSPSAIVNIDKGETQQIQFRLRFLTNDADTPPIINGLTVSGVGQLPEKYMYTMPVIIGDTAKKVAGTPHHLLEEIENGTANARVWTVIKSQYKRLQGRRVLISVPAIRPDYSTNRRDNATIQMNMIGLGVDEKYERV